METTINQRIGQLITAMKMSHNAFAKSINKASTTINYIVDGKGKPSYDVLEGILEVYPEVSPDWLMKGQGEMFRKAEPVTTNKSVDGGAFGEAVLGRVQAGFDEMRRIFEEELRAKNQQIAFLQRMLEAMPGKSNDVTPDRSEIRNHPATGELFALWPQVA
ncbi:helix-turn-helix domain-containing protein [uncultured Fibrella sp.]|uniref:helix-turn-helix domain-containing protein n=1 Tax=uncultured Fibrella sp. TaxID=1284596 RepID=UPI0035CAAAB0